MGKRLKKTCRDCKFKYRELYGVPDGIDSNGNTVFIKVCHKCYGKRRGSRVGTSLGRKSKGNKGWKN